MGARQRDKARLRKSRVPTVFKATAARLSHPRPRLRGHQFQAMPLDWRRPLRKSELHWDQRPVFRPAIGLWKDRDGDVAHEFWEEDRRSGKLKRIGLLELTSQ